MRDTFTKRYRYRKADFLDGPLPLEWLARAARLRGSALVVGLTLWRLRREVKRRVVVLSHSAYEHFGLNRQTARRGLRGLESAGLVQVERRPGHAPRVRVLPAPQVTNPSIM